MRIKTIMKCCTAILLVSHALTAFASNRTLCPSANFAKSNWQKLNTVGKMGKNNWYEVHSDSYSIYDENNALWWQIGAFVYATDFNSAFHSAQEHARNVDMQINKYANETGGNPNYLTCHYTNAVSKGDIWLAAIGKPSENRLEQVLVTR